MAVRYADSTFSMKNDVVEVLQGEELKDLYDNPKTNKEILFAFTPANFPSRIHNLVHNYYSWYGYESSASTSGYNCVISRDYEEIMDQEKDLRWTYFTEPSGRFNGRYNTKKYNGGKYEAFSGYYSFACPVVFIRAGEVILNRAEAYMKLGESGKALADLNYIRQRAGLSPLSGISGWNYSMKFLTNAGENWLLRLRPIMIMYGMVEKWKGKRFLWHIVPTRPGSITKSIRRLHGERCV